MLLRRYIFLGRNVENKEIIDALNALIEIARLAKEQPDAPILAARYTVYGMVGVAFLTLIGQLITTRLLIKSEMRKVLTQITAEKESDLMIEWNRNIQDLVTDLLVATDPQLELEKLNKVKIIGCAHKLNLMLNLNVLSHDQLNNAINNLALNTTGWGGGNSILDLQDEVIKSTKQVIYQPKI